MLRFILLLSLSISASTPIWADCLLGKVNDITPVFDDNRVYLRAKINDKPVLFIVDTAASQTVLFQDAPAASGLTISSWGGQEIPNDPLHAETTRTEFRASTRALDIGRMTGRNVYLRVVDKSSDAKPDGLPVVGVLGEDFLSHFEVDMDIKAGLFALYRPEGCESANLAYWSKDYNVADMMLYNPREPHILMSGKLGGSPIVMQIDSGRTFTAVSVNAAGSRGVRSDSPNARPLRAVTGIQGELVDGWVGTFSNFALDEEKIGQAKIAVIKFASKAEADIQHGSRLAKDVPAAEMLLGFDFLRAHHVLISHSQRKVYFSYEGDAPFVAPKS